MELPDDPGLPRSGLLSRLYRGLLQLLPAAVREEDGDEMVLAFEFVLEATDGAARRILRTLYMIIRLLGVVSLEWLDVLRSFFPRRGLRGAFDELRTDGWYFLRSLKRDSGLASLVVLIVGAGVGASATVFSVVNTLFLRPLPFDEPDRLVWISNGEWGRAQELSRLTVQSDYVVDLRSQSQALDGVAGYHLFDREGDQTLQGSDAPERLTRLRVTEGFFELLGVSMLYGRTFSDLETSQGGPRSAILAHDFWQRRFGSDPGVVGQTLTISGQPTSVIGVLPESFDFPDIFAPGSTVDYVAPFALSPESNRSGNTLALIGRLASGIDLETAESETRAIIERVTTGDRNDFTPWLVPLRTRISGHLQSVVSLLGAAVGLVMVVVCANLANLLLARGTARRREFVIRSALGADPKRLARQALTESTLLASAGAALGILLAFIATRTIAGWDVGVPLLREVRVDGRVLGFSLATAWLTGLAFGMLPALRSARTDPDGALQQGGRSVTANRRARRVRSLLVVSEVALTCVLLVGAGLLTRSLVELFNTDLGFEPQQAYALRIDPAERFASAQERTAYFDDLLDRAGRVTGVDAVGVTDVLPVSFNRRWDVVPADRELPEGTEVLPYVRVVSEGYLGAMGLSLIQGRDLSPDDHPEGRPVALVNDILAEALWPDTDPIGRQFRTSGVELEVVGVTRGMRHLSPDQAPGPEIFLPLRQMGDFRALHLVIRSERSQSDLSTLLTQALQSFNPDVPIGALVPIATIVDEATSVRRLTAWMLVGFGAFTLLLAAVGLYGVIAHSVSQRRKEIGIRLALGDSPANVRRRVLEETLRLTAVGVGVGIFAAFLLSRGLSSQVYGIATTDPVTFLLVPVVLVAIALISGLVPAFRASRVDPMRVLAADG